jgi:hypothetical protein
VSQHCYIPPMEEVEDPIVCAAIARSQFVNAVSQVVGFRPPQFVPQCS